MCILAKEVFCNTELLVTLMGRMKKPGLRAVISEENYKDEWNGLCSLVQCFSHHVPRSTSVLFDLTDVLRKRIPWSKKFGKQRIKEKEKISSLKTSHIF